MRTMTELAREAGVSIRGHYDETGSTPQELKAFVALVRADEREACAKVCDGLPTPERMSLDNESLWEAATLDCAEAIRNRGNT
jgi:hypothetical protein